MLVPQGLAYAELTGLPPMTGVYTTIAALLAYAAVGPNRRLVLGPDSSLAPVIAAVVLPLAAGDADRAVVLASALSLLAGVVCIAAGALRFGAITELLSKPIRIGYLNGIALLILLSQLPKAFGFSGPGEASAVALASATVRGVVDGAVVPAALGVAAGGVLVIMVLNRLVPLKPGVIVAAVGSAVAVAVLGLGERGVELVGEVPTGVPPLVLPIVGLDTVGGLLAGAVAVTLVSFADTGALSTATSLHAGERIAPDDEIRALGAANLLSGLFQGFATSASSSRTAVALAVGARTQVAGLVAALGVLVLVVAVPGLVSLLPEATLAAIVIAASFSLFDLAGWRWLARVRRSELLLSVAATVAVLALGVLEGLGVAVGLSLANFVRRAWRPYATELRPVPGVAGYHDLERHPDAEPVPGLLLLRFDAPLFFANGPAFARLLQEALDEADRPIERVVVVANAVTDVDTTGAEFLVEVLDDLDRRGVAFAFAGLKGHVRDRLARYGLVDRIGREGFHPNTISAVEAHEAAGG